MKFDAAFELLMGHEGDFSNHHSDPGGKTRFGVTEATAREVGYRGDMQELPLDLAKRIYKDRYWDTIKAEELPSDLRYVIFDAAVNSGPKQAVIWLQRAAGVTADGVLGPKTLAAVAQLNTQGLKTRVLAHRLRMMSTLASWPAFSRGWSRRIADLMES